MNGNIYNDMMNLSNKAKRLTPDEWCDFALKGTEYDDFAPEHDVTDYSLNNGW